MPSGRHIILRCTAEGRGDKWEAICLDLDLAVQGRSFEEVYKGLNEMIFSYLETVSTYPPADRARLLNRRAPFALRLKHTVMYLLAYLFGRDSNTERHDFTALRECPA